MAEVKWIKLVTEFFDDEKIKLIESMPEADMVLIIWVKLLTLAGKKNMNGYIFLTENIPYTEEMLSTLFNRPINTIRLALETFKGFGMIDHNGDGKIKIANWEKHQNVEGMDKIRERNRLSQQRRRKNLKKNPPLLSPPKEEIDKRRLDKMRVEESRDRHVTQKPPNSKIKYSVLTNEIEGITKEDITNWSKYNSDCNVTLELATIREWVMDKPDERVKKICRKFIIDWVKKTFASDKPKKHNKAMTEEEIYKMIGGKDE